MSSFAQQKQQHQPQSQQKTVRDLPGMESAANALLDAVNRSKRHLVKFILEACEKEVEVVTNYRDFKGKTPLIRAVYITEEKCRQKILDMLLAHGANPNYQDDAGRTALSYACELRHNDVVRLLVRYNVDPELPDCDGNTPLMHCALVGNDTGIGILIKCFRRLGLDIDRSNKEGFTAMLLAARFGFTECASLLALDGHASVTRTDPKFGRNAEQWARAQGCTTPEVAAFSPDAGLSGLGGGGAGGSGAGGGTSSHRRRILLRGPCRDDPIAVYPSPARGSGSGAARGSLSASMPARALQQQAGKADQRLTASGGGGGDTDSDSESSGSSDCSNRRRLPATLERDECSPPPSFGRRHRGGDSGGGQSAGTSMSTLDG